MTDRIPSDNTIPRKPVDSLTRKSDSRPGPSSLRPDLHYSPQLHQYQAMPPVLLGDQVGRLGAAAVARDVMGSFGRSQEAERVRRPEEEVSHLRWENQETKADIRHVKAGVGMDRGSWNLMEAHMAFEKAGRSLAEAKLDFYEATTIRDNKGKDREDARIRLQTAKKMVGGDTYHSKDTETASKHAQNERERVRKSIEDIEERIEKASERRQDT